MKDAIIMGIKAIGYGEGIKQAEEDWGVFVGFGEGITSEENWGF